MIVPWKRKVRNVNFYGAYRMLDTAQFEEGGYCTYISFICIALINVGGRPAAAAVMAAPILKQ